MDYENQLVIFFFCVRVCWHFEKIAKRVGYFIQSEAVLVLMSNGTRDVDWYLSSLSFTRTVLEQTSQCQLDDIPMDLYEQYMHYLLFIGDTGRISELIGKLKNIGQRFKFYDSAILYNLVFHFVRQDPSKARAELASAVLACLVVDENLPVLNELYLRRAVFVKDRSLVSLFSSRAYIRNILRVYNTARRKHALLHEKSLSMSLRNTDDYYQEVMNYLATAKPKWEVWGPCERLLEAVRTLDISALSEIIKRDPDVVNCRVGNLNSSVLTSPLQFCLRAAYSEKPSMVPAIIAIFSQCRHYMSKDDAISVFTLVNGPGVDHPDLLRLAQCLFTPLEMRRVVAGLTSLIDSYTDPREKRLAALDLIQQDHCLFLYPLDEERNTLLHVEFTRANTTLDRSNPLISFLRTWVWLPSHLLARNTRGITVAQCILDNCSSEQFPFLFLENRSFVDSFRDELITIEHFNEQENVSSLLRHLKSTRKTKWEHQELDLMNHPEPHLVSAVLGEYVALPESNLETFHHAANFEWAKAGFPSVFNSESMYDVDRNKYWLKYLGEPLVYGYLAQKFQATSDFYFNLSPEPPRYQGTGSFLSMIRAYGYRTGLPDWVEQAEDKIRRTVDDAAIRETWWLPYMLRAKYYALVTALIESLSMRRLGLTREVLQAPEDTDNPIRTLPLERAIQSYTAEHSDERPLDEPSDQSDLRFKDAYECIATIYSSLSNQSFTFRPGDLLGKKEPASQIEFLEGYLAFHSPYLQDENGKTIIHYMTQMHDEEGSDLLERLRTMIEDVCVDIHMNWMASRFPGEETPLDLAITGGRPRMSQKLLAMGADANLVTLELGRESVPLSRIGDMRHGTVFSDQVVPILLKSGASILLRDTIHDTIDIKKNDPVDALSKLAGSFWDQLYRHMRNADPFILENGLVYVMLQDNTVYAVSDSMFVPGMNVSFLSLLGQYYDDPRLIDAFWDSTIESETLVGKFLPAFHAAVAHNRPKTVVALLAKTTEFLVIPDSSSNISLHFVTTVAMGRYLLDTMSNKGYDVKYILMQSVNSVSVSPYGKAVLRLYESFVTKELEDEAYGVVEMFTSKLDSSPDYRTAQDIAKRAIESIIMRITQNQAPFLVPDKNLDVLSWLSQNPSYIFLCVCTDYEVVFQESSDAKPRYPLWRYIQLYYGSFLPFVSRRITSTVTHAKYYKAFLDEPKQLVFHQGSQSSYSNDPFVLVD